MNGDAAPFGFLSLYLPLPYRVVILFTLGIWFFGLNIHYLQAIRIDIPLLLRYTRNTGEPPLHLSIYRIAIVVTALLLTNLLLFWSITHGDPDSVRDWQILPISLFLLIPALFLWPGSNWHRRGRLRFTRMLRRILVGGLDIDLRFSDILLADALTSYAKVLGDIIVLSAMAVTRYSSTHPHVDRAYGASLAPFAVALPSACRLRQCMIEYKRAKAKGLPWAERRPHLLNAAKYASAFPVVVLSYLQLTYNPEMATGMSIDKINRLWLVAVVLNSLYSFWWDVTKDWDLTLFTSSCGAAEFPFGLRKERHFVNAGFYYVAVGVDLVLRLAWAVKFSGRYTLVEGHVFLMEVVEVTRRWMWLFLRVEKEWIVTRSAHGLGILNAAEEGIMMNEYED
ncbi:EXS-domain-containing protein [Ascodesmis nigricans]|uniref:EXS-domain-containing protein n=1 Tax=Ascodesmis nigricans TaxID=341454 RepID=A0A4S2N4Q1_9PEZI|nr:EXS-domain-containing protein [Ascodesmis nigricans]